MLATANGYPRIVKLLLKPGMDVQARTDEGETPYQESLRTGNREIADLLREPHEKRSRFRWAPLLPKMQSDRPLSVLTLALRDNKRLLACNFLGL